MSGAGRAGVFFQHLLNLIYPAICRHCELPIRSNGKPSPSENIFFCGPCWQTIPRLSSPACPVCAAPFQSDAALSHSPGHVCGDCREDPPSFAHAVTPYRYEGVMVRAIRLLKYHKRTGLVPHLVALLMEDLNKIEVDLVTATPLHVSRLRSREFNQALVLAKEISRRMGWVFSLDALSRIRETEAQVGLSKKQRKKNLHRAFVVPDPNRIAGKKVLLMDDVYTTGATLKEGARTLMKAGAKEVVVCAPARVVFGEARKSEIDGDSSSMLKIQSF